MTVMPRTPKRPKSRRSSFVPPTSRSIVVPDALSWRNELDGSLAPKGPAAWTAASSTESGRTIIDAGPYGVIDLAVMDLVAESGRRNPELGVVWWDKRSLRDEDDDFGTIQTSFVPSAISDHGSLLGPSVAQPHPRPREAHRHASLTGSDTNADAITSADASAVSNTSANPGHFDALIGAQPLSPAPPVPAHRPTDPDQDSRRQRHVKRSRHAALTPAGRTRGLTDTANPRRARLQRRRRRRRLIFGAVLILVAFVATLLVQTAILTPFTVPSVSMQNTLNPGDRILVDRLANGVDSIHRGDVVVFSDPGEWLSQSAGGGKGDDEYLVKRVIGLPGDHVACCGTDGRLTVNGTEIQEPYAVVPSGQPVASTFDVTVPAGALWVLGDNRYNSRDSSQTQGLATKGFVPISNVVGHAFAKIWPLNQLSPIESANDTFASLPKKSCPI